MVRRLRLARDSRRAIFTHFEAGGFVGNGLLPYDVIVHCHSNLNFRAYLAQSGFESRLALPLARP